MISVVIPAFNEQDNIANTVKTLKKFLKKCEIIVIDDASSDNTSEVAKKAGARVFRNKKNMQVSYSIFKGIKKARHNKILCFDADNEIPVQNIKDYLDIPRGVFITGYRGFLPRRSERFLEFFTRSLLKIRDPLCYMKYFDKRDLGSFSFPKKNLYNFPLIELAVKNNLVIKNIPLAGIKRREDSRHGSSLKIWINLIYCCFRTIRLKVKK